jgi:hypothetical protein
MRLVHGFINLGPSEARSTAKITSMNEGVSDVLILSANRALDDWEPFQLMAASCASYLIALHGRLP